MHYTVYHIFNHLSADPGLCQGRGGAWDHRRCGTWLSGRKQRRTPSRQHLCQLHAPAIYMLLPNSYTYMPLPSVFQEVQDCRLPGLKPSKRFRRPPRQQLLQLLHAPAICFSGGSRLPFARPQTPQTLPTLPQASKATTLTATCPCHLFFRGLKTAVCPPQTPQTLPTLPQASKATTLTATTCPCHLFFRGLKTAVCPPSNPPNASNPSAGLQGNNSYSYMPLPSVFQGVQDCRLPALKPPKPFRRPPRQQLLQLHAPAICFSGGSRLPFARPQTPQTLPQASKATTLKATCPCHLFFRGFKTAVCPASNPPNASNPSAGLQGNNSYSYMPLPSVFQGVQDCRLPALKAPQTLPTLPQASKATTLTATCPCHLFFRGFKTAVCPPSNPPNASNPPAGLQGNNSYSYYMPLPSVFQGVQDCRLPALKRFQPFRRPPRQQLLQLHAPAICFSGGSRLPFARPQTPQTLPQASKATTLTATCPCHLFFRGFKTAVCPASNPPNASNPPAGLQGNNSYSYMPLPSVFQEVQDCRLPGLKPSKRFRRPPRQQLLQLHAPAICFSGGSRLPFARPQTPQTLPTLPQASKATTLTATCPCHLFFRGFKTAVCPASNPPNASNPSAGLQGNNSYSYMPLPSVFQGVQDCRLPALKPPKPFRRPPRQQLLQLHAPAICFSGGSRLPFARPQTPQTLPQASNHLHAPAICFSGGSRLPLARPQTLQTLPQASKATTLTATTCPTTLTATCPCHLFFREFKTAVCPASNPPNASNPPAGLQGNNSYSYMPLPSVFQGVQDCRLPALKPPKRFQPFRRPPRQQLLQLHAPAICFSGGSRLPFARPQTPQTLPQASKATTLTATCPCHLFFRGFKTAVCPPSNPPNPSAGLQPPTCPCHLFFRRFKTAACPASNPPNASAGLQGNNSYSYYMPNNSYSYMPLPSVFLGVQDCRLPGLKPPKRFQPFRRPPRQQLLQLHAPAICFSGGSRLPFARPQSPPNASNPSAGLQGNNSYSYMPLPSVFQGVQDCCLPALKPPKRFQPSRRPPRQQLLQLLHAPAICFSGGSRLPFARPQTLPTLPQASKATTLTATCPCHLFFRGFKTAVCPPSNPPNPSAGLQGNNSYSYMSLPSVFQGVQDCRLPGLKPPKRFQPSRRPPRQQLLQLHAPAICFSGGSRLPFARPQTLQTLPQASKATTLTATCPCHLFFRGFKTAVCPPSNPPNASNPPAGLQGNNSYSYMSLPSVFQGVQDCRLPGLKPPKRFQPFRRPPRQQLLQLHAPAICFSGGSRLPFARPQTPQTLPQASKATTLTATCPCHLFFRGFKTAVCPASNPPNASNPPAGLQGNNSYSYMPLPSVFQEVQDCRLPGLKPSKRFRRPPRQQLLQLHAPAICFSGGSRLPFARPQTPQTLPTLPQASKATTLTATCPCHLFFRGFKTAVCPASNPPNASNPSAGLQGNNSYSYMPLPSVFQGVQDCRLPALKPPKPFRRPPRQQLLQLHAPAICFSGGSRLPFARPQTPQTLPQASNHLHAPAICFSGGSRLPLARPQTLQTLPQASKATTLTATTCPTTLTATCPCHLFFREFKTAVCPASNPPNASNPPAGLQGNNSYSYMPLPSVFQGVQDCRLPALKPPKRFQPFRRPPRQQLLQLHAPAICFSGGSRLPFARPQTPQTLPQASKATTLTATCPCHLFFRGFKTAVCPPSNPPNPSAGLQPPTCPCHLFFRRFKTAACPASNPPNASAGLQGNNSYSYYMPNNSYSYMPLPSVFLGVQDCRLPGLKPPKRFQPFRRPPRQQLLQLHAPAICFSGGSRLPFARPQSPPNASNPSAGLQGNNSYSYMPLPSVFQGVQDCCLPALKPPKRFQPSRRPPRQQLLQLLHAPAICFSGGSRLPFARPQTLPTLPQASKATTLTATCPCHLFFRGFKTAVCPPSNPPNPSAGLQGNNSYSYMSLPSVFQGVQDCRLPGLKPPKRFQPSRRPPRQQLLQLHAPAICFSGGSRLPFARPQTLQTLPQASKATTLTATCPCHLFFRGFKTAVCPPSNPPNASNPPAGLQGNNSYSYMSLPSVFQGVQDCRLPGLKPPKRFQPFRRPPRQQLLQLHAPAICFSGGSRLPFARPQTPQTLPQASKATTLTATCPCHLFFRGFKTAVCPPSNPPNPSAGFQPPTCPCHLFFRRFKTAACPASNPPNASAGFQGNNSYSYYMPNNSYSYMPLPSVFPGVQDCRLPGLKPPKRFQPSRRPPRQQLLQLHAPAICFSGGSRLPFARPQTPQTLPTLPQASKATTLTATCPCHLFFRGFKTAVCPPSNPPNPSAGLQGNNSYSYMPLPSVFQGVQDCRLPALKPPKPFRRPPTTYMPLPSVFQEVQDCRLPGLKPSKRFRRPPRQQLLQLLHAQQLLQLHAPAICFSGSSRLPFARPQTPQTLPTLPQASKATTLTATCPCHLFFRGFKTAVCPPQTPQTLPTLPQASKATTLTATCPCHLFFRGFKTAVCPPSNPPNASNPSAGLQGNNSYSYMPLPSVFQGVQDRPPRQQLLQLHAPAICFSGGSRLPFARPQTPQTLPQASKATTLTATCPCHLFFRGFKTGLQGNNSYSYMPLPSVFQGVQDCRLPALKPPKPFRKPPRQQLLQLHAPAICFSGGSRLPFARPKPPKRFQPFRRPPRQQLLQLHAPAICFSGGSRQASKATTLTATCPCHLFFRGFKTAVCPPSNASNPPAGLQGNNSYSYMSLPSVFQGVQDCRLPALKPPKPFRKPPRQQLLQLHAPAICFSGGSRLPFARPQTPQTLPQASKATTLTATCPCHLFFRGFKTAVCPPSIPPNASNPPAGLQGNNSYSYYMPLPSVFQGVQDCRLPGLKPPKRFQPSRRPPRQQLLQLHAPAICFSGGSRLPFARPQTPQTLPQASKATTLTATCPCHLFFRGFKTAVCPPSIPPNASAGLQGNTLTATCPCHLFFRGFKTAVCPPSNPPNASNPLAGLQGNNSYSYMPLPSVFQGVQDCRLPALKPPKHFQPSRRPARQQL